MKNVQKTNMMIIVLLLAVIAAMGVMLVRSMGPKDSGKEQDAVSGQTGGLAYEANIITGDADGLQAAVDRMYAEAKEGQMALEMKNLADSGDGKKFNCFLANAAGNQYDMFMVLYLDSTQEEIYRSGLIPVGGRIESFELKEALKPGTYEATLMYNQVEKDNATIHARVNVGLTLTVR